MKRFFFHIFCTFLLLSGVTSAVDETLYDLRGPALNAGMKLQTEERFEMKGVGSVSFRGNVMGQFQMSEVSLEENDLSVDQVDEGVVTKLTRTIIKKEGESTSISPEGKKTEKKPSFLVGLKVKSEKTQSGWKHTLDTGKPSGKQKNELADLSVMEFNNSTIPSGKHKIGATWDTEGRQFTDLMGLEPEEAKVLSGRLKSAFTGLKEIDGESCAVIEHTGSLNGKVKVDDDKFLNVNFTITGTEYRSLRAGVTVITELRGEGTGKGQLDVGNGEKAVIDFQVQLNGYQKNAIRN